MILLDYYANHSAYAKDCENKTRPMMHCNGKCHMIKKMQQEKRKTRRTRNGKWKTNLNRYYILIMNLQLAPYSILIKKYPGFPETIPVAFQLSIFHPPQV